MTFQPVVPIGGLAGWRFLERTLENQQTAFNQSAQIERSVSYFRDNIGSTVTAEQLVNDRRLLEVALGAFGLEDDINNKFFIQTVLQDGTTDDDALANRLADKRYLAFSQAFGFGDQELPQTLLPGFADTIVDQYQSKSFEIAVGNINNDMRLALSLSGSLEDVLGSSQSNDARWFSIMGNPPMRQVFESAFGLPSSIGAIDLDQQLETFKEKARVNFGTDDVGELTSEENQEAINRLFLLRSSVQQTNFASGASTALTLLSQIAR